mmetsp:Transcript_133598/g.231692  ORF Transcript_133598/g.231692 Transcript_133598/m.231692 type:complete len:237 (+) Transcript_133598:982-1692(+)
MPERAAVELLRPRRRAHNNLRARAGAVRRPLPLGSIVVADVVRITRLVPCLHRDLLPALGHFTLPKLQGVLERQPQLLDEQAVLPAGVELQVMVVLQVLVQVPHAHREVDLGNVVDVPAIDLGPQVDGVQRLLGLEVVVLNHMVQESQDAVAFHRFQIDTDLAGPVDLRHQLGPVGGFQQLHHVTVGDKCGATSDEYLPPFHQLEHPLKGDFVVLFVCRCPIVRILYQLKLLPVLL